MTTAHRPTWKAAVGRSDEGPSLNSKSHINQQRAHTKLKFREEVHDAVSTREQIILRAKEKLEAAEKEMKRSLVPQPRVTDEELDKKMERKLLANHAANDTGAEDMKRLKRKGYDDADDDGGSDDGGGGWSDLDDDSDDDLSESESDDDSDDEDEEAALQAELDKIKKEREIAKAKEEAENLKEDESRKREAALIGNPLLGGSAITGKVKRRWGDDVPFRNQARSEPEQNRKRFINDTVRNDFHKRFLNKFIR